MELFPFSIMELAFQLDSKIAMKFLKANQSTQKKTTSSSPSPSTTKAYPNNSGQNKRDARFTLFVGKGNKKFCPYHNTNYHSKMNVTPYMPKKPRRERPYRVATIN